MEPREPEHYRRFKKQFEKPEPLPEVKLLGEAGTVLDHYVKCYTERYGGRPPEPTYPERQFLQERCREHTAPFVKSVITLYIRLDGERVDDTWFIQQGHSLGCLKSKWPGLFAQALLEKKRIDAQQQLVPTVKAVKGATTPPHISKALTRCMSVLLLPRPMKHLAPGEFSRRLNAVTLSRAQRDRDNNRVCGHCYGTGLLTLVDPNSQYEVSTPCACTTDQPVKNGPLENKYHTRHFQDLKPKK